MCLRVACRTRQGRDLDPERVLPLLRAHSAALTAQYLEHLVAHRGSQDAAPHTELALTLARSILARMPPFDDRRASVRRSVWFLPHCHSAGPVTCQDLLSALWHS